MTTDLRDYDAVLLDLDGTIWHEDVALPGAIELIRALQRRGQPFAFISNNDHAPARLLRRFAAMGVSVDVASIFTASLAACDHVRHHHPAGVRVFGVAGAAVGELLGDHATLVADDDPAPADVVLSAALGHPTNTVPRLQVALRHLLRGARLVSFCADRRYPTPSGAEVGGGALAAMLAYAANVAPTYCGKPERLFFQTLCDRLRVAPSRCAIVGDNLESDIRGAKPFGMRTILPLTGVTSRDDLARLDPSLAPDVLVDDLTHLR